MLCLDETGVSTLLKRDRKRAEAFLELAHSFLYKLRGGSIGSALPPAKSGTPFFQLSVAVYEFCDMDGDLQADWDRIDLP